MQLVKNLLVALSLLTSMLAFAGDADSPAGLWQTRDDDGKPTGYIRINEADGTYSAVIEKGMPQDKEEKYCTKCTDERKDRRLIGMTIMKNVKAKGVDKATYYIGDEILDPLSGNTYRVKLTLKDAGKKLEVRGFIGISLFGRTQIWERAE